EEGAVIQAECHAPGRERIDPDLEQNRKQKEEENDLHQERRRADEIDVGSGRPSEQCALRHPHLAGDQSNDERRNGRESHQLETKERSFRKARKILTNPAEIEMVTLHRCLLLSSK